MTAFVHSVPARPRRILRIWQRQYDVWRTMARPLLIANITDSSIFIVGLGLGLGGLVTGLEHGSYVHFIAPGAFVMMAMYAASFELTFGAYTRMVQQRTWDAITMTPASLTDVVWAEILWSGSQSILPGVAILGLLLALGLVDSAWAAATPLVVFLTGVSYGAIAIYYTAFSPGYHFYAYFFSLIITPMLLLSGIFFPVEGLPAPIQVIGKLFPLTHAVDMSRALIYGTLSPMVLVNAGYLILVTLVFGTLAARRITKRLTP